MMDSITYRTTNPCQTNSELYCMRADLHVLYRKKPRFAVKSRNHNAVSSGIIIQPARISHSFIPVLCSILKCRRRQQIFLFGNDCRPVCTPANFCLPPPAAGYVHNKDLGRNFLLSLPDLSQNSPADTDTIDLG